MLVNEFVEAIDLVHDDALAEGFGVWISLLGQSDGRFIIHHGFPSAFNLLFAISLH